MVEDRIAARFAKKVIFTVQGKNGHVEPFLAEQANSGFLDRDDPNTQVIQLNYPVSKKTEQYRVFGQLENRIRDDEDNEQTLMIFYFTGESSLKGGKIVTDLGVGPFPIEKRVNGFCQGATNLTTWAIWDCPRQLEEQQSTAKAESDSSDCDGYVPIVSTYA